MQTNENMRVLYVSVFLCLICIVVIIVRPAAAERKKIVIDTDAGSDDAIAILLAVLYANVFKTSKNFEVIAITCVYGNTNESNVEQNVLKTLTVVNRSDIPVYRGAQKPLLEEYEPSDFFGNDGFGDFNFTEEITAKVDESKLAAVALIDLVKKYPGEVTIVCIGPLTNIAIAISLDSSFAENIKELIVMGASVEGIGNQAPNVEFNFSRDPESNFIVFNARTKVPIVLFPWETVLKHSISKDFRENVFGKRHSKIVDFLNKAENIYLENVDTWSISDAMATAIAIWPELITNSTTTNVTPVYNGMAKGTVLVDYANKTNKRKNAKIVKGFDVNVFVLQLLHYVQ